MRRVAFAQLHPLTLFFYYAGLFGLCLLLFHPLFLAGALLSNLLFHLLCDGGRELKSWLRL